MTIESEQRQQEARRGVDALQDRADCARVAHHAPHDETQQPVSRDARDERGDDERRELHLWHRDQRLQPIEHGSSSSAEPCEFRNGSPTVR
jgi:hypothetical protein